MYQVLWATSAELPSMYQVLWATSAELPSMYQVLWAISAVTFHVSSTLGNFNCYLPCIKYFGQLQLSYLPCIKYFGQLQLLPSMYQVLWATSAVTFHVSSTLGNFS